MEYQEIFNELKALQNRAFNLYKKDKTYIKNLSKELDVEFVERENCKNCFANQINFLMDEVKNHVDVIENANCDYVVIGNKDVTIKGKRINNNSITNEVAEWLIRVYPFHAKYIKKK